METKVPCIVTACKIQLPRGKLQEVHAYILRAKLLLVEQYLSNMKLIKAHPLGWILLRPTAPSYLLDTYSVLLTVAFVVWR